MNKRYIISIIGVGYVGLPLAISLSKYFKVIAYDLNKKKIQMLQSGVDPTNQFKINSKLLNKINFTNNLREIKNSNVYIITVPTPVYKNKKPNLKPTLKATKDVSKFLKNKDIIIYESTFFPTTVEKICIPFISRSSGLKLINDTNGFKNGFYCGYSPERINPGDHKHTLEKINKIIASNSKKGLQIMRDIYGNIIKANLFETSITVAEMAKIIENTQRDINIAFINEISLLCKKLNIETTDVIKAASTKWNFLNFSPGLVGGHCIGIDPYYLSYLAERINHKPKLILSGREVNENLPMYIAKNFINQIKINKFPNNSKILIMGVTFKENTNDIRNSKYLYLAKIIQKKKFIVDIYDPNINKDGVDLLKKNELKYIHSLKNKNYVGIIRSINHKCFSNIKFKDLKKISIKNFVFFDLQSFYPKENSTFRL